MASAKVGSKKRAASSRTKEDLVAHYACGNVSLQTKRYVTAEEKARRKKKILAFKFL